MKNPAIAIECDPCGVPINPVLHPKPDTPVACPKCGASEAYEVAFKACLDEFSDRVRRKLNSPDTADAPRLAFKWRFREGLQPVKP